MKEYKKQILAALALALALGAMVPGAAIVNNGAAYAAQDSSDVEELDLGDSIVRLYNLIQESGQFATYKKMETLIKNTEEIYESGLLNPAMTWADATDCKSTTGTEGKVSTWLSNDTVKEISKKKLFAAIDDLKKDGNYQGDSEFKKLVDELNTKYTSFKTTEATQLKEILGENSSEEIDKLEFDKLVEKAESLGGYANNQKLYNSMKFLDKAITGGSVSLETLNLLYSNAALLQNYSAMYNNAKTIATDPSIFAGLYPVNGVPDELPNTGAGGEDEKPGNNLPDTSAGTDTKPNTPNTGIVGLFESGALDLGTVTLIVSVALASVAGLGLIAKLYLKHKF